MTLENPIKVSVIVAVYNTEKYLRQCLDSIAGQTLSNLEIICVNDGSTDGSLAILEEYAAKDARFCIFSKENEGLGAASARNFGLDRAKGEYISVLDSDDFFEPDMLEKAVKKADETNADMVMFSGKEYDERTGNANWVRSILDKTIVPEKETFSYADCPDKIYQLTTGMAWNKLFRRAFLEKRNLRFQRIKYSDDAYFTFAHMVLAEKIAVLKDDLCYYRVNSGVNQTAGITNYPDSTYRPYLALKDSLTEWGIYDEIEQSFLNYTCVFMRYCYDRIDRFDAFKYLHDKLREEVFDALDISGRSKEYFYDVRIYQWVRQVLDFSAEDLIFRCIQAYGSPTTTAILRFPFPYDKIPMGSRVALIGAGIMGRHLYTQAILSGCVDVVSWGDCYDPDDSQNCACLKNVEFDYAIIAYENSTLKDGAISFLRSINVANEKIVLI